MDNRRQFIKNISALGLMGYIPELLAGASGHERELTWHASGTNGIVAAGPRPSAEAGLEILTNGGNAVDAAVAVIFNLAVCDYGMFSIGGEVPFMYYDAKNAGVKVFNGMGGAPKNPRAIQWYYKNGIPEKGIKAATTPSAVSTCLTALAHQGTMSLEQVLSPTLLLLDKKCKSWYQPLAKTLRRLIETERNTPGARPQKINAARDRFYKGDIADELHRYYVESGGFLTKHDLMTHKTIVEDSVSINYKGFSVHKCNTWTQGPVFLQTLKLLEHFDLRSMGNLSPRYIHTVVEAMKLAFADRDRYYGDPDFVKVPLQQLLSDQYAEVRYPLIDINKASTEIRPGDPIEMKALAGPGQFWPGERGTTTCVVVDKWGNTVAATPSSNPEYGLCETLGIAHNTRLSSLNVQKGHPNALAAGKRPRITLTPTIVLRSDKPVMAMSVAGQDMQDQTSLQLFLDVAEFELTVKKAVLLPRFRTYHLEHSFNPSSDPASRFVSIDKLDINLLEQSTSDELSRLGHNINITQKVIAFPAMITIDQQSGACHAAANPGKKYCAAVKSLMFMIGLFFTPGVHAQNKPLSWSEKMAATVMTIWKDSIEMEKSARQADWAYFHGVVLEGFTNIWKRTDDDRYIEYVKRHIDHFVGNDGSIRMYYPESYELDKVKNGKTLLALYKISGRDKYKKAADLLRDQMRGQPRTKEGGYWHQKIYPYQMWLDGLYMSQPFLAEYAAMFYEPGLYDDIADQFVYMESHARDEKTGLLYHGWDESKTASWADKETGLSKSFWGRAMGWFGMGLVDVLEHFPNEHPKRKLIIDILNRYAEAVTNVQDPVSGVWYQVLDKPSLAGNYKESSCSNMFVYTLAKAVRLKYIPAKYEAVAKKGFEGILKEFMETGSNGLLTLKGTVVVAGLSEERNGSYEYYISERVKSNDPKGVGSFLLASNEMELISGKGLGDHQTRGVKHDLPVFYENLKNRISYPMSWLSGNFSNYAKWKKAARKRVSESLIYDAPAVPFNAQVLDEEDRGSYVARKIAFAITADSRVIGLMLIPKSKGPHPAVLLLHDHGAKFDIGKEKMIAPFKEPEAKMVSAKKWTSNYGGRFIGDELAKRGYVCFSVDMLNWSDRGGGGYEGQQALAANLLNMGTSFAGIIASEDIRAAKFLASQKYIDSKRIAAMGWSVGAFRTWQLAALSENISAGVSVCWMATRKALMVPGNNMTSGQSAFTMTHTQLPQFLDYPDVAGIACPKPMMFASGGRDELFPVSAIQDAFSKMRKIWESQGAGDKLVTNIYDAPHEFNLRMQEDAFAWLDTLFDINR